jgi:hypothetical protein
MQHVSVQEKEIMKQPGNGHLNMQGRSLRLAQIMWAVLVILLLGVFIAALPPYFSFLQTTCSTPYNCFGVPTAEHDKCGRARLLDKVHTLMALTAPSQTASSSHSLKPPGEGIHSA